jgi:hypothetical protein
MNNAASLLECLLILALPLRFIDESDNDAVKRHFGGMSVTGEATTGVESATSSGFNAVCWTRNAGASGSRR